MIHKRFGLWMAACAMTAMTFAQPKIKFIQEAKDLGTVLWRNPVTLTYQFKNTGDKSLVVSNVTTSCGCTGVSWTREPIPAGGEGEVKAVFDAGELGHFSKEVGVYCNASVQPIYLTFTGEVTTDAKTYAAEHLHRIGSIGIDKEEIAFDDVNKGERPTVELMVVNNSKGNYTPVLMHLPPYLEARAYPERLGKGKVGKIVVTLDSHKLPKFGITTSSVYLARFPGDKVSSENEIPVSAVLLPDFSKLTEEQRIHPPVIGVSETMLDFSGMSRKKKLHKDVQIINKGTSDLRIQDLQVFTIGLSVRLNKRVLKPGESTRMRVTLLTDNLPRVKGTPRILMITNDPKRPKISIGIQTTPK